MADVQKLLAELTDCDFKVMLEVKKPKRWLKSVSAFANERGGGLIFGMADDKSVVGFADIKRDIDIISKQINERVIPLPTVDFRAYQTDEGKDILIVEVKAGNETPYFYSADGNLIAYVRVGSDSIPAPPNRLRELVMRGMNLTVM
ncbi:MAG: ATP-binding protein [Synergistaceae bacterium]|nr:ATP-binding protein [Synergistaceae bacterium]